jgi:predicted lipoprotein
MLSSRVAVIVALGLAVAAATGCKIKYDSPPGTPVAGVFDAKSYVNGLWDTKVLPLLKDKPVDVRTILAAIAEDPDAAGRQYGNRAGEGEPWTYLVKGVGTVKSVDVTSRHGTMIVELKTSGPPEEVVLQIGPVVFGTSVRDSLPFVSFGDFVNQIEYAEVSRALNDKAIAAARGQLDFEKAAGKTVTFTGAATAPSAGSPLTVTPFSVELANGGAS